MDKMGILIILSLFLEASFADVSIPKFPDKFRSCTQDRECKIYTNACLPGWVEVLNLKYDHQIQRIIDETGANNQLCEAQQLDLPGYKSISKCMSGKCKREVVTDTN